MSGFNGFGGGGFGQQNQQNTTSFSGFGNNNASNPSTGFGFGSNSNNNNNNSTNNNTSGSLFGGSTSGFGSTSGGFGNNNSSPFGAAKPAFGATSTTSTGGGLFGNNASTTTPAFGSGFGSSSTGMFGGAKPATGFGSNTTGGGGLFGSTTTGSFGSGTTAFGSGTGTSGFGAASTTQNNGTEIAFNPQSEKDGAAGQTVLYQSISCMDPYKAFCPEELRVADYAKGRRYGNANGQAGAFGQSTGFGGFGSNSNAAPAFGGSAPSGGGLFGQQSNNAATTTTSAFGGGGGGGGGGLFGNNASNNTTNSTPAFGGGGGGLFGTQNKTGGLFGSTPATTATTSAQTGGLFGAASSSTSTPFGGAPAANTSAFGSNSGGGGLFGNANNQSKPFGSGFGSTSTNAFGSNTQPSAFGTNTQQGTSTGFSGFGQAQNATTNAGGLFGQQSNQTQAKPSLFGSAPAATGTSLFGNQQNQQQSTGGGLFGQQSNQQQPASGGLFGAKSAGTGLFGNAQNTTTSTGGGLFGNLNNQPQQNQGTSLFGQQQQTQNKPLFGASNNSTTGGGLFGGMGQNQQNQQQPNGLGTSLFGQSQPNQQQQQPLNNSLFGSQSQQRPQGLVASLDNFPYGNEQLFAHLENPSQSVGPIATPLSSAQKTRKPALLPQHKLNPAASTRLITPQKRPPAGFGFSYSTYGTPGSAAAPSPGFANNLLGGTSFGRSLGKSFSASNLRGSFNAEDSILAPGAFSSAPRGYSSGSLKRLQINRSINTAHALFANQEPSSLKKSVTFENGTSDEAATGALVRTETEDEQPKQITNGESNASKDSTSVGSAQGKQNGLDSVPENSASAAQKSRAGTLDVPDPVPGAYWMKPTLDELKAMSREQLRNLTDFTVGREGCGNIVYHQCDLSQTPLDQIAGGIVRITHRSGSTYEEEQPVKKPPRGSGLNVPATITLANCWPRKNGGRHPVLETTGPHVEKHISRLKRVDDTTFINYDREKGEWSFRVEHFTIYGLNYDDMDESTMLSAAPDTPTPGTRTPSQPPTSGFQQDLSMFDGSDSGLDDTFEFKRKRRNLPGGFGEESELVDEVFEAEDNTQNSQHSFLDERSVGSLLQHDDSQEFMTDEEESSPVQDQDMAGSFPVPTQTTELPTAHAPPAMAASFQPKSILKVSQANRSFMGTPSKRALELQDDWTTQLQRTVSPKKRDRQVLKESQGSILRERKIAFNDSVKAAKVDKPFRTSMDIMKSIYGQDEAATGAGNRQQARSGLRSQVPFQKKSKVADATNMDVQDRAFHQSLKPRWSADGTLTYTIAGSAPALEQGFIINIGKPIVGEVKDIRFAQVVTPENALPGSIKLQRSFTAVKLDDNSTPHSTTRGDFTFADLATQVEEDDLTTPQERHVWELASILFDSVPVDNNSPFAKGLEAQYRKEKLSDFWQRLVQDDADQQVASATSAEQRAIQFLSAHDIVNACGALIEGHDPRLATMVAQIGGSETLRKEMASQIEQWRSQNMLSEITEPIRALYELLSGNCAVCEGKSGAGAENKANDFKLAARFGLDWRRAFGLRLWYGTLPTEDIPMAVAQFESDLREGREDVRPVPWFVEQGADTDWTAQSPNQLEDVLWGLLKLYAAQSIDITVNIEDVFAPVNASGNPLDARLSWQLLHLFGARENIKLPVGRRDFGHSMASSTASAMSITGPDDHTSLDNARDALTLTFGALIEDTSAWVSALWIYTHLSDPSHRAEKLKQVLALKAYDFDLDPDSSATDSLNKYTILTSTLRIPESWLHAAKALYARAVLQSPAEEITHLLAAKDYPAAHNVLCTTVAPQAIISRDYDVLRDLLPGFHDGRDALSSANVPIGAKTWSTGGQVYFDFVYMIDTERAGSRDIKSERQLSLRRLISSLEVLGQDLRKGKLAVEERAAVWEIARWTVVWAGKELEKEGVDVGRLPLMEDGWLRCARERGVEYFKGVLASAR